MNLTQALLIAFITALAGVDYYIEIFQSYRPVVLGTIIGLVMGDLTVGLVIGGTFELMWMGLMPIGGAQPPNMVVGTAIGVVFAIASGEGAATAIGIGVPFSILMQGVVILIYSLFAGWMPLADKKAEKGDIDGIGKLQFWALLIVFMMYFVITFIPVYLGADKATFIVSILPIWIVDGFTVAGGVMPAIGFAILLNTMYRKEYAIFLALGFILTTYLQLPIIAISALAVCVAVYDYKVMNRPNTELSSTINNQEEVCDDEL